LVLATREYQVLIQIIILALTTLTGVVIPVGALPHVLREIGYCLPISHGLVGLRASFNGAGLGVVSADLALEGLIATILTLSGFLMFRFTEIRGRERGLLLGGT